MRAGIAKTIELKLECNKKARMLRQHHSSGGQTQTAPIARQRKFLRSANDW